MNKKILLGVGAILLVIVIFFVYIYQSANRQEKITDPTLLKIKERGILIVASDIPYGVMEFLDENDQPAGIDVDIAREIANKIGVKLYFKDCDWNSLFEIIKSGEADLAISSITINSERSKEMLFSNPYFNGGQVIVTRAENIDINFLDDLADKKIGVQRETTGQTEAQKYTKAELIRKYDSYEDEQSGSGMAYDLQNGNIDAIILDYVAVVSLVKKQPTLKMIGEPFTQEFYGIATKLGNNALMEIVNETIREIKTTGKFDEIKSKWIN